MALRYAGSEFQSTLPVWGATYLNTDDGQEIADFNPRSPCGERPNSVSLAFTDSNFNPRSPCGERRYHDDIMQAGMEFQSTLPVWGATLRRREPGGPAAGFQSTLPVWGATLLPSAQATAALFQSTLPVWGATDLWYG